MLNTSSAFKQKLYNEERDFINRLVITLANGTELTVDNEHIMGSSGVELDDAVSEDDNFSALGSTVINSVTFVLYNNDEIYSDYDFKNAKIIYYTGLNVETTVNDQQTTVLEEIRKGTFTVDDATYSQATITLYALDYMEQFDRPYSTSTLVYPATLAEIVRDACYHCLGSADDLATQQFPHYDYQISERPSDEAITYREIIGYAATVAGCFARCNVQGKLELKWFDTATLYDTTNDYDGGTLNPWTAGDTLSGGTLNPWTTGDTKDAGEFTSKRIPHYIASLWSADIAVDDVVITGVSATIEVPDPNDPQSTIDQTVLKGTDDYAIEITDNPFINETNVNEILTWLQTQLVGLTFRKCNVTHQSDPSIEAGDIGYVWDTKGVEHPILITRATFIPSAPQTIVCGASTPSRNSATRFSQLTKSFVKNRKMIKQAQNPYAKALADLAEAVNSATGMYETDVVESGATIHYRHNKPTLAQSDVVIMESSVGITFTNNYQDTPPTWYGFTVDGNIVANLISALGVNFDWAVGTTLTLGGANNGNGVLKVLDADGNEVGRWTNTGLINRRYKDSGTTNEISAESYIGDSYHMSHSITEGYYHWLDNWLGNTSVLLRDANDVIRAFHTIVPEYNTYISEGSSTRGNNISESFYCSGGTYKKMFTNETMSNDETYSGQEEYRRDDKLQSRYLNHTTSKGWFHSLQNDALFFETASHNFFYDPSAGTSSATLCVKLLNNEIYVKAGSHYFRLNNSVRVIDGNTIQVTSSSKRYKHDITDEICDELDPHRLYDLKMKQFVYNDDHEPPYACMKGKTVSGFIAEDVDEIYPAAVIKNLETGEIESWSEAQIIAPMLSLIQEQKQQIDEQQKEIDELKERIEKLEKLMMEKLM